MTAALVVLLSLGAGAVPLMWTGRPARTWTPRDDRGGALGEAEAGPATGLVPEALDLLSLALLGGVSLGGAARTVAVVLPGAAGEELDQVGQALLRGADTEASWSVAGPDWAPARRCLEVAAIAGVPPGPSLRQAATDLRRESVAGVEVATARLGVRLVLPLGLAFLPGFLLTTVLPLVLALTQDMTW